MKRVISLLPAALLAIGMSATAFAADIHVTVDGTPMVWTDAKPFIDENSRTLVPLRPIANALGLEVDWNDDTNTAAFTDGESTVEFTVGSSELHAFMNDFDFHVSLEMDTKPIIAGGRIYAPARYLAESFDCTVGWEDATKSVTIVKTEKPEEPALLLPEVPAGALAAMFPVTAEAGAYGATYIAFDGVTFVEEPDIFEYSIDVLETDLNGLGFDYGIIAEENYVEMNMGTELITPPGTYSVTFTIPQGYFADAKEDILVSTTLTVTAPKADTIMANILDDLEWGLWVGLGSQQSHVIEAIAEEAGWMLEGSPFKLTVTDGTFVNNDEGEIEAFSCTLTVTNTETGDSASAEDTVFPLYFASEE